MAVVVKTNGIQFWGGCTTHFRTYFSGDWDVHYGHVIFKPGSETRRLSSFNQFLAHLKSWLRQRVLPLGLSFWVSSCRFFSATSAMRYWHVKLGSPSSSWVGFLKSVWTHVQWPTNLQSSRNDTLGGCIYLGSNKVKVHRKVLGPGCQKQVGELYRVRRAVHRLLQAALRTSPSALVRHMCVCVFFQDIYPLWD